MIELSRRGCRATLLELSPENVAFARKKLTEHGLTADAFLVGDARDLSSLHGQPFRWNFVAWAALPSDRKERTGRVPERCKIAFASKWNFHRGLPERVGVARSLLTDAPMWFADSGNVERLLTGASFVGARACSGFTECHWSTPDDALAEVREAGFVVLEEIGAQGFANAARHEIAAIAQGESRRIRTDNCLRRTHEQAPTVQTSHGPFSHRQQSTMKRPTAGSPQAQCVAIWWDRTQGDGFNGPHLQGRKKIGRKVQLRRLRVRRSLMRG